jgi:hypothetical protein
MTETKKEKTDQINHHLFSPYMFCGEYHNEQYTDPGELFPGKKTMVVNLFQEMCVVPAHSHANSYENAIQVLLQAIHTT